MIFSTHEIQLQNPSDLLKDGSDQNTLIHKLKILTHELATTCRKIKKKEIQYNINKTHIYINCSCHLSRCSFLLLKWIFFSLGFPAYCSFQISTFLCIYERIACTQQGHLQ